MRGVVTAAVLVAATALFMSASTGATARASAGSRCKMVTKRVHGHRKRVKVCKAKPKKPKPKPKPPPKPQADVTITMTSTLEQVTAGNHVYYTLEVANHGPESADGVSISADIPADLVDLYAAGGSDPIECSANRDGALTHVECGSLTIPPDGAGGSDESSETYVTIVAEPDTAGAFQVSAHATSSTHDPHPEDNIATKPLKVLPGPASADLSVKLTSAPDPASVTQGMTETISVTNAGPSEATDVHVTLLLPQGAAVADFPFSLFNDSPPSGGCGSAIYGYGSLAVACYDVIAPGQTATRTLHVLPSIHGPAALETDAVVSAYTKDANLTNDRATITTALSPFQPLAGVDVATTMDVPTTPAAGKPFMLVFHVRNLGLADAHGVHVTLNVAPSIELMGLALISQSDSGLSGIIDCVGLDCTIPELPSDGMFTGALLGTASAAGSYSAALSASPSESDAAPANNNASIKFTVSARPTPR
jgi:uncharacterized repeat protein (TIGR01451 family)